MSKRTPPESIAWLHHAAAAGQVDARLMLTMLERIEALEQRPEPVDEEENDRRFAACMAAIDAASPELLRAVTPEAAQVADDDEPQTLHTIALKMVNTLEQLGVLPEILDTLRRAIREPMQQPTPEAAPVATDAELRKIWLFKSDAIVSLRAVYDLGREHGAAAAQPKVARVTDLPPVHETAPERIWLHLNGASEWLPFKDEDGVVWSPDQIDESDIPYVRADQARCPHVRSSDEGTSYCALAEQTANLKPTSSFAQIRSLADEPVATCPPPVGWLVEVVGNATNIERAKWLGVGDHEARAAIRAVAWWLKRNRMLSAAELLEQEAKAPRQAPVPQSRVMP